MEDFVLIVFIVIAGCFGIYWAFTNFLLPVLIQIGALISTAWAFIVTVFTAIGSISPWIALGVLIIYLVKVYRSKYRDIKGHLNGLEAQVHAHQEASKQLQKSIEEIHRRCDAISDHLDRVNSRVPEVSKPEPEIPSDAPDSDPIIPTPQGPTGEALIQKVLQELQRGY